MGVYKLVTLTRECASGSQRLCFHLREETAPQLQKAGADFPSMPITCCGSVLDSRVIQAARNPLGRGEHRRREVPGFDVGWCSRHSRWGNRRVFLYYLLLEFFFSFQMLELRAIAACSWKRHFGRQKAQSVTYNLGGGQKESSKWS